MQSFPMFIRLEGQTVVIVGGGEQAAQKARLMLKTCARLVLVAPELEPELQGVVNAGRAEHVAATLDVEALIGARMVFVATGCAAADAAAATLARAVGALVNTVDRPDYCDALTPALVDRDPVVVAIGTEGTAPVLSRQIKTRVEEMLEPRLGEFAALAGRLRGAVAQSIAPRLRRAFWGWAFSGAPRKAFTAGAEDDAVKLLEDAIAAGGDLDEVREGAAERGLVSLLHADPGEPDLITVRAVQRLQEADVVFHDRLVDDRTLEYARRDAKRVFVGKAPGRPSWSQERVNRLVVAEAQRGRRVVRLKSGAFGRGKPEADACEAAGILWELVPGVTAARTPKLAAVA